nr:LysR family transcriptional regulator [Chondromyces crocatus]
MSLSAIDVNLVVALDALLRERSVTRAARRVGLSQPAMSHTLTRLREALGDPLLVRVGREMALTDRAEAMTGRVAALVQGLEGLFGERPAAFEPRESARTFKLTAADELQMLLLPHLQRLCTQEASRVTIHSVRLGDARIVEGLRSGELDLALGTFTDGDLAGDIQRSELYLDSLVGLARVDHPQVRARTDMDAYLGMRHLVVAPPGGRDPVDELLARRGLTREVALTVSHYLVAPHVIAASDLVTIVPQRLAAAFTTGMRLRTFELPFELPAVETAMAWHDRVQADPAHRWLRRQVAAASQPVPVGGRRRRG